MGGRGPIYINKRTLDEIVRAIRDCCDPVEIVVFGSRARGDCRPDSDLDLMVVVDDEDEAGASVDASVAAAGIGPDKDIFVIGRRRLEERIARGDPFETRVAREGVPVYAADREDRNGHEGTFLFEAGREARMIGDLLRAGGLDRYPEFVALHAQRVAERCVRAALEESGYPPPRDLGLTDLLRICLDEGFLKTSAEDVRAAAFLEKIGRDARYQRAPDVGGPDAEHALRCADRIAGLLAESGFAMVRIGDGVSSET